MKKILKNITLVSLLLSTLSVANSVIIPAGTQLADKQELKYYLSDNPPTLDPNLGYDTASALVLNQLFEGLVRYDLSKDAYVNSGAESYTISDDLKTWTFKLRKDAKWSDGKPVTAHDYVYSWRRIADPATATSFATYLSDSLNIVNANEIINGKKPITELGVKAIDDYTFEITTNTSVPWLYTAISYIALAPVRQDIIEKHGSNWTLPKNLVSNGAFKLEEYIINERVDLVKNDYYRDAKNVYITKIDLPIVKSEVVAYNKFFSNELDIVNVPRQLLEKTVKEGHEVVTTLRLGLNSIVFNLDNPKFKDIRVREAIRLAVNNEIIVEKVVRNNNQPIYNWVPKGIGEGEEVKDPNFGTYAERIKKATNLIKKAGYSKSKPLKISLLYNTSEAHKAVFISIQDQINKAFKGSVIATLENVEWKVFLDRVNKKQFEVARKGWGADFDNASNFLSIFLSNSSSNDIGFKSEKFDNLYKDVLNSKDSKERAKIFAELNSILINQYVILPIFQSASNALINPKLKGYDKKHDDKYFSDYYFIK